MVFENSKLSGMLEQVTQQLQEHRDDSELISLRE